MVGEFMAKSRVACALAGAALSVLVLSGCQGGDPGAAQTPAGSPSASASASTSESPSATPTPTPTPSPASAAGPAVNIPVPEKPALADENSVEGLEAFTEWWFELLNYAYATNDLEPLKAVTDEGCTSCGNIEESIASVYKDGGWLRGGDVNLESFGSEFATNTKGSISSFAFVTQDAATYYNSSGEVIREGESYSEPTARQIVSIFAEGSWLMLDLGTPGA